MPNLNNSTSRHILALVGLSLSILLCLSVLPWSRLTNNALKDFNLFEDLFPPKTAPTVTTASSIVDPELEELMAQAGASGDETTLPGGAPLAADTIATDSVATDSVCQPEPEIETAKAIEGSVAIENYTGGEMLAHYRQALTEAKERTVRVAVIGDSYIEGDIFCSHLRDILQQRYGGSGVGFMPAHCEFPGFRQTVAQSSNGWEMHDIRNMSRKDTLRTLSSDYGIGQSNAFSMFEGRKKFPTTNSWDRTTFVFLAKQSGSINITDASGVAQTFEVTPSDYPQAISLEGTTTKARISCSVPGIVALGTYLDAAKGVQLDCMSIRGNSGLGTSRINAGLCRRIAQWADYDLIIVEFGMNVLSAEQTDYTPYMINMTAGIRHLQVCYPDADIIIMGVGDRGVKAGTAIESLPTIEAMTKAQRETARRAGVHFWDTRAAMGGDKAAVDWRKRKLLNADYIHLNHDGGGELANIFDKALTHALEE